MLSQPGALIITTHEPMLVQASESTKASLVLMVCETGAPRSTSMCLVARGTFVISGTTGADAILGRFPRHTRYESMLVEASARSKALLVAMVC